MTGNKRLTNEEIIYYVSELNQNNTIHLYQLYEEMQKMCHLQCHCNNFIFDHYLTEEDFFQDTILMFWKYKHTFDPNKGAFVTWYNTLIKNLYCQKYHKRKNSPVMVPLEYGSDEEHPLSHEDDILPTVSAEDSLIEKENIQLIWKALLELKSDYRDALILTKLLDKSSREVAEDIGISEYTLNVRICRAKKALEQKLLEYDLER